MSSLTQHEIKEIKRRYLAGTRVRLFFTSDPYTKLREGSEGTVDHVDDIGTIHVNWDDGSTLGMVFPEDKLTRIIGIAQIVVEEFARLQEDTFSRRSFPCPRCGKNNMKDKLTHNALSRQTDIYVCEDCGMHEAVKIAFEGSHLPFEEWDLVKTADPTKYVK